MSAMNDPFKVYDTELSSRLLLGTALYPSPEIMKNSLQASKAGVATVSLRRETAGGKPGQRFWDHIQSLDIQILPNTAGCHTAKEAITTAMMARELFDTRWIKLEVIANDDTLQPDVFGLVEAAAELTQQGFEVFPYTTEDLGVADRLLSAGCRVLMPWGAPIGSGQGLNNKSGLKSMRAYYPDIPLIVDAGIGAPSHAAEAMELGYDGILLNTAVAKASDPVVMAKAFSLAIEAGRYGYLSGLMHPRDMASPSTPVAGTPFIEF